MNPIDVIRETIFDGAIPLATPEAWATPESIAVEVWAALVEHGDVCWISDGLRFSTPQDDGPEEHVLVLPMPEECS